MPEAADHGLLAKHGGDEVAERPVHGDSSAIAGIERLDRLEHVGVVAEDCRGAQLHELLGPRALEIVWGRRILLAPVGADDEGFGAGILRGGKIGLHLLVGEHANGPRCVIGKGNAVRVLGVVEDGDSVSGLRNDGDAFGGIGRGRHASDDGVGEALRPIG